MQNPPGGWPPSGASWGGAPAPPPQPQSAQQTPWGQAPQAQPPQAAWGQQPQQGYPQAPQPQPQGYPQAPQPQPQGYPQAQQPQPQGYPRAQQPQGPGYPQAPQAAWGQGQPQAAQGFAPQGAPSAAMVPAGAAALAGGGTATVMGVPLQPGERVVYFHKPSYAVDKAVFWIVGLLTLIVLIGIIFIVLALLVDKRNPRAQIVTNRRVIRIDGKGNPSFMALADAADVDVERQKAQSHGQGLIGLAVSAAVNAVANSIASNNAKIDRKFWARGVAVIVLGRSGQRFRVETRDAQNLGPCVAKCVLQPGSAEQMPTPAYEA